MRYNIPSADQVRHDLEALCFSQLQRLAEVSGVTLSTLRRIKSGDTKNPDVDRVKAIYFHMPSIKRKAKA